MTRRTVFRMIVAMRLLPNFTAYWWMLPRRMKRIRTQKDLTLYCLQNVVLRYIQRGWERSFEVAAMLRQTTTTISPISEGAFRIPFRIEGR